MPDNIKSLRNKNDSLKSQLESLRKEFKDFQTATSTKFDKTQQANVDRPASSSPDAEIVNSLEFLSNKYDDLYQFRLYADKEIGKGTNSSCKKGDTVNLRI